MLNSLGIHQRDGNDFPSLYFTVILILISFASVNAQSKDNLSIFFTLADSASNSIINMLPLNCKEVKINFEQGNDFGVFTNQILENLKLKKINIFIGNTDSANVPVINFTIINANVRYGSLFRNGILGDYFTERNLLFSGNYSILYNGTIVKKFNYSYSDTINYNQIKQFENVSYPFTKGEIPAEPFFSSFYEPIVAVGASALAVILFFTIRSK